MEDHRHSEQKVSVKEYIVTTYLSYARERLGGFFQEAGMKRALIESAGIPIYASIMSIVGGILIERGMIPLPIPEEKIPLAVIIGAGGLLALRLTKQILSYSMVLRDRSHKDNSNLERAYIIIYCFYKTLLNCAGSILASRIYFSSRRHDPIGIPNSY